VRKLLTTLIAVAGIPTTSVIAHHSVTGAFDSADPFEISGRIVEVEWINPHVHIHVEVPGEGGQTELWSLETAPTQFFRNAGVSKSMLEGDGATTTFTGIRGLDKSQPIGWIYRITYADGRFIQTSASR
jgi:hypothetical protein